jgi:molybdopterin-binding protein/molybdate transport repressor ModE-like protein
MTELTALDLQLLREVDREGNLVRACRRLGIGRDRGVYRMRRLVRALGRPVARTRRGGPAAGSTVLTAEGQRLLREGSPGTSLTRSGGPRPRPAPAGLRGVWHRHPSPRVDVEGGLELYVTFEAREGEPVDLAIPPDSVLLARGRFPTSARNVLPGRVVHVERSRVRGPGTPRGVEVSVGKVRLWAAVTDASVHRLRLKPGRPVVVYLKATAVHRR